LHMGATPFGYDFEIGVRRATGRSMGEIRADWLRTVTTLYGAEYSMRPEMIDVTPPLVRGYEAVSGIRIAPNGHDAAMLAEPIGDRTRLVLYRNLRRDGTTPRGADTVASLRVLSE